MQLNKAFNRCKKSIPQAAFVGAAGARWNQVHIAFAHRLTVIRERHTPVRALAFGKCFMLRIGKSFAFKHRNHQIAIKRLGEVVVQAALVKPSLAVFVFLSYQCHRHTWHQHGLAAQQVHQIVQRQNRRFKILSIRPGSN